MSVAFFDIWGGHQPPISFFTVLATPLAVNAFDYPSHPLSAMTLWSGRGDDLTRLKPHKAETKASPVLGFPRVKELAWRGPRSPTTRGQASLLMTG